MYNALERNLAYSKSGFFGVFLAKSHHSPWNPHSNVIGRVAASEKFITVKPVNHVP